MEWSETLLREADRLKEPRGKVAKLLSAHCHGLQNGAQWPQSYAVVLGIDKRGYDREEDRPIELRIRLDLFVPELGNFGRSRDQ